MSKRKSNKQIKRIINNVTGGKGLRKCEVVLLPKYHPWPMKQYTVGKS